MTRLLPFSGMFVLYVFGATLHAQGVGINSSGAPADTSAILDVNSTSKGFLPPRMTSVQRMAIPLPATGLVVYQTDGTPGFFYNAGSSGSPNWRRLLDSASVTGTQWTTSGSNIYYGGGNVGIHVNPTITDGVLDVGGRMRIRSGGDLFHSAGLWLNNVANTSLSAFVGMESDTSIGLFGNTGLGWGLGMNTTTGDIRVAGRLGLGVSAPNAPLTFAPSLGKKITLYPGVTGDVGFAVQGNLLQMYSDNPSADIAFGFDQAGTMTELMRIKANGNVGIGTATPNAPLSFPPTLTHKITLYPGATGDVGFGVAPNRLQIYSDNPNADVAIGYDAAGTFNERFAVKPTGAVAVNGNTGSPGQVLQSNGGSTAATWNSPTNALYNNTLVATSHNSVNGYGGPFLIPGLTSTFVLNSTAKVWVSYAVGCSYDVCTFCGNSDIYIDIYLDGVPASRFWSTVPNGPTMTEHGANVYDLAAGTHTIALYGVAYQDHTWFGSCPGCTQVSNMIIQIIPQ